MADKKISELPLLNSVSGSSIIVPLVHDGTTNKLNLSQIAHYASQWSAKTGSANTFTGNQSVIGNVNISGKLTVNSIEAVYETSSILYTSGSTQIGDQITDVHTIVGTINLNGLALGTNELMAQTASQAAVNLRISSTTGSINTTTSSFDLVFLGISSVTGSINVQSSSQDLVNRGISSVTGAINTTTSSFDSEFGKIGSTTASLHFTTSSLNAFTGSIIGQNNTISTFTSSVNFATQSLNTQTGSQDLVNRGISSVTGSINTTTSSFDSVFLRISSTTGSINTTTSSFDSVFLRISSTTGSINTTTSSFDSVFLGISSVTGSLIGITNTLMAFTAALDNTYATDAQLYQLYQATASIHSTTSSLNIQTGSQDLVNRGISSVTGSINTTTSSFDLVFRGISSVTGAINTTTSSFNSVFSQIGSTTSSLIGITNALMAFTAALDSTYATDAQLYQLYQATSSIHSTTASLNTQTGSQGNLNAQIGIATSSLNTFSGSIRDEVSGLEAYTASLKAAAIVSSSTQISNYYKFAETASANTFYGNQTFNNDVRANKFVFTDGVVSQNVGGQNIIGTSGNILYLYTGTSGLYINNQANNAQNVTISDAGVVQTRGKLTVGAPGNDQDIAFGGTNSKLDWAGSGAQIQYNVGALQFSSVGTTNNMILQQQAGALFNAGITGSLMATNNVVSSSTQIQNYNLFAQTSSLNTFYGNQTITGSLRLSSGSLIMQNRPAFRVVGTSTSDRTGVYTMSGSNFTIDYNEGNHFNITNGKFTAPIDGLYQVYLNARCGSVNAQQQIIIYKNGATGTTQLMWEAPGNTGVAHFGVSSIVKLVTGDTLEATVTVGSISFDGNDSWGVAFIG